MTSSTEWFTVSPTLAPTAVLQLALDSLVYSGEPNTRTASQILGLPIVAAGQPTGVHGVGSIELTGGANTGTTSTSTSGEVLYRMLFDIKHGNCSKIFEAQAVLIDDGEFAGNTSLTR
jgi:hypothetical protein